MRSWKCDYERADDVQARRPSAWVCTCHRACVGEHAIAAAVWRAPAHTISTPGFGRCLALPDQPSCPKDLLNSFSASGSPTTHTSRILATNSVSVWNGPNQSGANSWLRHMHLFFLAQGSQTANPLSECLLSQRAQAEPTQVLGPNYRKNGKPELATDWASWVNVNATTEGYFILRHGCNRDREDGRFRMEQTKALRLLKNTYKLWHVLLFLRHCETSYAGMIRAHPLNTRLLQCCSQRGSGNVPNLIQTRHNGSHSSVLLRWCCVNTFLDFDYPRVILSVLNVYIPSFIVFTQVLIGDLG